IEASDNFIAVNFEGVTEVVNKKEHIEKLSEQKQYREGQEIEHEGNPARIIQMTDNLALVKDRVNKKLKLIKLEKEFSKVKQPEKKREPEKNFNYEQQPEYN